MLWGGKYESCVNCGTTERPRRRRGHCNKCSGPAMQLSEVAAWDRSKPETLRRCPGHADSDDAQEFEWLREGYMHELQRRLDTLRHWEQSADDPADGIEIEFQLDRIARYAGATTRGLYHGLAGYIDWQFSPEQRKVLRELLRKIELDRPWRGVDVWRVFEYRDKRREESHSSQS